MKCVLSRFNYNKLVLDQLFNLWKVSSIILLNSIELEPVAKTLVSSTKSTGIDVLFTNKGRSFIYSETSIYRSRIIRFPRSVVQFLWSLSESYFNYGSRIYCFPGSIVSFLDPRRKRWIEVSLYIKKVRAPKYIPGAPHD
jgi:hypothetical protein